MGAESIPKSEALKICKQIRTENSMKIFSLSKMQCGGCMTFSKDDVSKMCFANGEGNRGCNLVNTRYDKKNKI